MPAMAWGLRHRLGERGALALAWALAVSPSLVYYARDAIHETLLVASTLGLVVATEDAGREPPKPVGLGQEPGQGLQRRPQHFAHEGNSAIPLPGIREPRRQTLLDFLSLQRGNVPLADAGTLTHESRQELIRRSGTDGVRSRKAHLPARRETRAQLEGEPRLSRAGVPHDQRGLGPRVLGARLGGGEQSGQLGAASDEGALAAEELAGHVELVPLFAQGSAVGIAPQPEVLGDEARCGVVQANGAGARAPERLHAPIDDHGDGP